MRPHDEIDALYKLDDQAQQVLKNLRQIMLTSKNLNCVLADDAENLYMRLRVVLGAIGEQAFNSDEEAQYEAGLND